MLRKTSATLSTMFTLACVAVLSLSLYTPVGARSFPANGAQNNCTSCHEDLYFLHDTGNWFCLQESPMGCVDCHGGDPEAVARETAHFNRAAHPVINEDVSKCQECHPEECEERVELFNQTAGISQILVAIPYTPADASELSDTTAASLPKQDPGGVFLFWEFIPLVFIASLALIIFFVARRRNN